MKKILCFLTILCCYSHIYAQQWESLGPDDLNVFASKDSKHLSVTNGPNNTIFVAYVDEFNGDRISVKQYKNNKWEYVGTPGFSDGVSGTLDIALDSNSIPYVIFTDHANSEKATVMRYIGSNWELVGMKGFTSGTAHYPSISIAEDGTAYVVIKDGRNDNRATVYSYTNDVWSVVGTPAISEASTEFFRDIKVDSNGIPYVAYLADFHSASVSVQRFVNGNWEYVGPMGLAVSNYNSSISLEIDSNNVPYISFRNDTNGGKLEVRRFMNQNWEIVGKNEISTASTYLFSLTIGTNDNPIIAFSDGNNGGRLTVKELLNDTWEVVGAEGFSSNRLIYPPGIVANLDGTIFVGLKGGFRGVISNGYQFQDNLWTLTGGFDGIAKGTIYKDALAIGTDMKPYIVFPDQNNDYKATVMQFNNGAWEYVGTKGFSSSSASNITMDIDSNNIPYVFYSDGSHTGKATIQRYINGAWEIVGTAGFSTGQVQRPSIVLDPNNIPYIVFDNYTGSNNLVVYRFLNNIWEQVGAYNFTGPTAYTDLAFTADGTPYLAYQDGSNGYREAVQRFVNGNWERVGTTSQASGYAYDLNIEITADDIPYIAYRDSGNGTKATVQKFVNNSWEFVGTNGFTSSSAIYTTLAISPEGTPYVAYKDGANSSKLTVQKYENSTWEVVGDPGISSDRIEWPSLKVAPDGTVYTAYYSNNGIVFAKKFSDNTLPVFTNSTSINIEENTTGIVDINTTDDDGDTEGNGISYTLTTNNNGGVDNSFVTVDVNTGELSFLNAPNFEAPLDSDTDNTYEVQITATDSDGGTTIQDIVVTITNVNDLQLVINSQVNVLCFGEKSGAINLTVEEGNSDYNIKWERDGVIIDTAIATEVDYGINNLSAGVYTITVTDSQNDEVNEIVTIAQPSSALNAVVNKTMVSDTNAKDGSIALDVSGGVAPYTYLWSTNETTRDISSLEEGTYNVTIIDANECSLALQVTILKNSAPLIIAEDNVNIAENQLSVINLEVTDEEGETEGNGITYQFTSENGHGNDNQLFKLNTENGQIDFLSAPDFESPLDENDDNIYHVQVSANDSYGATSVINLVITVTNLENDFDEDGIEDSVDTDDDNDGTLDTEDAFPMDATEDTDTDGDGVGNNADNDDDNDGTSDTEDAFPLDATEDTDTDDDGIGNNADMDDDNDGTPDTEDAFPLDATENTDTDGDGIGNNNDMDDDGDGIPDSEDAFPLDAAEDTDTDGDGIGNNADNDDDNDGIPDSEDNFPLVAEPTVSVPKGFSPNGDGINDTWVIEGLGAFPNNTVTLYNRSGAKVFSARDYQNNWDGVSNGKGVIGSSNKLPVGAYYYVIDTQKNQEASKTGWIYINY